MAIAIIVSLRLVSKLAPNANAASKLPVPAIPLMGSSVLNSTATIADIAVMKSMFPSAIVIMFNALNLKNHEVAVSAERYVPSLIEDGAAFKKV